VFKLIFEFSSDDYLENDALEKTYAYRGEAGEAGYSGESEYDRAIERTYYHRATFLQLTTFLQFHQFCPDLLKIKQPISLYALHVIYKFREISGQTC
jgi:hypothetical protein